MKTLVLSGCHQCVAHTSPPLATALSHVSVQSIVNLQHFSCTGCIEARVLWRNAEALSRVSVQSTPTVPNLPPHHPQVLEFTRHVYTVQCTQHLGNLLCFFFLLSTYCPGLLRKLRTVVDFLFTLCSLAVHSMLPMVSIWTFSLHRV